MRGKQLNFFDKIKAKKCPMNIFSFFFSRQGMWEFLQHRPSSQSIKRLQLIKENQTSEVKKYSAFPCIGKVQESGLPEIIPFICISAIWGQYPMIFHFLSSSGLPVGSGCSLMADRSQIFFSFWSAWRAGITNDCDILVC